MINSTARKRSAKKPAASEPSADFVVARAGLSPTSPPIERLAVEAIERHPDNRHPDPVEIESRAESMRELGQLEPILVRPLGPQKYQVVSGETRLLAARHLGWPLIEARVREMTDAEAQQILGAANFQRKDLTTIEKAQRLLKLTTPENEGGGGLTQEAAGKLANLSRSAVANLIRLLKAPKDIRDLVAWGKLPETYLRPLLPFFGTLAGDAIAEGIRAEFKQLAKNEEIGDNQTRDDFVERIVESLDATDVPDVAKEPRPGIRKDRASVASVLKNQGDGPQLFALDELAPEELEALGVVECKGMFRDLRLATNGEAYRSANLRFAERLIEKLPQEKAGGSSKASPAKGGSAANGKAAPVKSEKEKAKEAVDRLKARLDNLAINFHCDVAARALSSPALLHLASCWLVAGAVSPSGFHRDRVCEKLAGLKKGTGFVSDAQRYANRIEPATSESSLRDLVANLLYDAEGGADVNRYVHRLAKTMLTAGEGEIVDLERAWDRDRRGDKRHLTAYLAAHDTEPLRKLLQSVRISAGPAAKKGDLISYGLAEGHLLPLPPAYRLAEPKAKGKGKKGAGS